MSFRSLLHAILTVLLCAPGAWAQAPQAAKRLADLLPPGADLSDRKRRTGVVSELREAAAARKAAALVAAAARGLPVRVVRPDGRVMELMEVDGAQLVYAITHNTTAAVSTGANLLHAAPYAVTGSGIIVGEWDAGSARVTHQEFGGRATASDGAAADAHASHVGGTIAAAGVSASAKGMAPAVRLESYDWNSDKSEMTARAASYPGEVGMIPISNHSYGYTNGWFRTGKASPVWDWWGSGTSSTSLEVNFGRYDNFARDSDSLAAIAPYYLMVRSAGNERTDNPAPGESVALSPNGTTVVAYDPALHPAGDGTYRSGYDTIGSDAVGKNVLTIGSVSDAVSGGSRSVAAARVSSFSSWGPTDDGRIKPDLVANGEFLYSISSGADAGYTSMSGTSMSAPNATGSAALLISYFQKLFPGQAMRASTLKGLLIHTADDLGTAGPDYRHGWGLINVKRGAAFISEYAASPGNARITESRVTSAAATRTHEFTWDGVSPIRATLVWTDPAGSVATGETRTGRLVNNLDLKIIAPGGAVHSPYVMPFVGDWSNATFSAAAITGKNNTDNVEQVFVATPAAAGISRAVITVDGTLSGGLQNYSLIISGGAANPVAPALILATVAPDSGNTGEVVLNLAGSNLLLGARVTLTKSGQADVAAYGVEAQGDTLKCRVETTAMAPGTWNVVVTNPDEQQAVVANGFTMLGALWQEDMESGAAGWMRDANIGSTYWALSTAQSQSATSSLFAPGPATKNTDNLYSPPIAIPADATNLRLIFWHSHNLQNGRDGGTLEFSLDGGAWFNVAATGSGASFATGGYTTTMSTSGSPASRNEFAGQRAWSGNSGGFRQVAIDLTDTARYAGHILRMRWRLATDGSSASYGWHIDDVLLIGGGGAQNLAPSIEEAVTASPEVVTGKTAELAVVASASTGEASLTYMWAVSGGSFERPVQFSANGTNSAKNTTATFSAAGDYRLTVTVRDTAGLTATSSVDVAVVQTGTALSVTPASVSITYGESQSFTARTVDQFGDALASQPETTWSASGGGTIDPAGRFTATAAGGPFMLTASSGNFSGTAKVTVAKAVASVTLGDLTQTYTGATRTVTAATVPAGVGLNVTYNGVTTAPVNAGTYAVVATITDPNYSGSATGTLVVQKAQATVSLGNLQQTYTGTGRNAVAATTPAGLPVTLTYDGSTTEPVNAGSYAVLGVINDPNYSGSASGTLVVSKAAAALTLQNLEQTYNGTPRNVTATTAPAGLKVNLTYEGSVSAPVGAGSYEVVGTIEDPNYAGSSTGTLRINKAPATVALGGLEQTYTGDPRPATAVTNPPELAVEIRYDGLQSAPVHAGTYKVEAVITDPNYVGGAVGTLVIAKAPATVTLGSLELTYTGEAQVPTVTTTPNGLKVDVIYDGAATLPVNAGTYQVTATVDDRNHIGAASGELTIKKAPATVMLEQLEQPYTGNEKTVTATTAPGGLSVHVSYDGTETPPKEPGTYSVSAEISDSNYMGSASGTFLVTGQPLTEWKSEHFTAAEIAAGQAGGSVDFDRDGLSNLMEYALGADPRELTAHPTVELDGSGHLVLTFKRPKALPALRYYAEVSEDLSNWERVDSHEVIAEGDPEMVRFRDPVGSDTKRRRFIRLRVDSTAP